MPESAAVASRSRRCRSRRCRSGRCGSRRRSGAGAGAGGGGAGAGPGVGTGTTAGTRAGCPATGEGVATGAAEPVGAPPSAAVEADPAAGVDVALFGCALAPRSGTSGSEPAARPPTSSGDASTPAASGCFGVGLGVGTSAMRRSAVSAASSIDDSPLQPASTTRPTLEPAMAAMAPRRPTGACSVSNAVPPASPALESPAVGAASTALEAIVGAGQTLTCGIDSTAGGAQGDAVVSGSANSRRLPLTIPPLVSPCRSENTTWPDSRRRNHSAQWVDHFE